MKGLTSSLILKLDIYFTWIQWLPQHLLGVHPPPPPHTHTHTHTHTHHPCLLHRRHKTTVAVLCCLGSTLVWCISLQSFKINVKQCHICKFPVCFFRSTQGLCWMPCFVSAVVFHWTKYLSCYFLGPLVWPEPEGTPTQGRLTVSVTSKLWSTYMKIKFLDNRTIWAAVLDWIYDSESLPVIVGF